MLQQTQVATVVPYYHEWLRRFPTFRALALASENDVLHAWQGLGYYTRARNLHATAKIVVQKYQGRFPADPDEMIKLPGLGRYTANAVATFAFGRSVPIVEANTARLLSRLFNITQPIDSAPGREDLWQRAAILVPKTSAARFNSALMDLGALVCVAHEPQCDICPVRRHCRAKDPNSLPIKKTRPQMQRLTESHVFVARENKILLEHCRRRWRGMWMLPVVWPKSTGARAIHTSVFPFTNHRITLRVFDHVAAITANAHHRWFPKHTLASIPIPSPHRRALHALLR
jgi:A/G-specific adenine glycosylase